MGIDLYETTAEPYDLMNTGGNFMSDGFGMGFASELIVEENDGGNLGGAPSSQTRVRKTSRTSWPTSWAAPAMSGWKPSPTMASTTSTCT